MNEDNCIRFWEFKVGVIGNPAQLFENSMVLNIVCSTLANHQHQTVVKIKGNERNFAKISLITKGEEAKDQLLISYSSKTMFTELQNIGYDLFSGLLIEFIELVQMGIIVDSFEQEFEELKKDVQKTLQSSENAFSGEAEFLLSNSSMVVDEKRIISEAVTPFVLDNLLRNISVPSAECSSACKSSSTAASSTLDGPHTSTMHSLLHMYSNFSDEQLPTNLSTALNDVNSSEKAIEIEELTLRDYQYELAKPGLESKNCIVLAPTGSGKTIVAAYICKKLIEKRGTPKILFLVDRVPLVSQQFKVFRRFLGDVVFQVSGDKYPTVPTEVSIEKHLMTVMTAEILFNLLRKALIKLQSIDLLIFDECHHATKKHVYNQIMWLYMDKHLSRSNSKLPQILGLSASLSVGKAKIEKKAEENIKMLMANLNVTIAPVQVVEHIDSLKLVQSKAEDERFTVTRHPDDVFANNIDQAMFDIEDLLEPFHDKFYNVIAGKIEFKPQGVHGKQDYEEWVVHLLDDSTLIQHPIASQWFMGFAKHLRANMSNIIEKNHSLVMALILLQLEPEESLHLLKDAQPMQQYNDCLMMNDHVRSCDVKDYLEEFLQEQPPNETTTTLMNIYRKNEPQPTVDINPLLEKLRKILTFQYQEKPNSRCIIFVRTRPIANALLRYLAEQTQLSPFNLNAKLLTGTNAKAENFGMTKVGQEDTLRAFRFGSCKVLVSTSVAEEGLDIKECNLIVTYNYATNEVGKVQRKGRGRAEDSRFIILAYSDSGIIPRESGNDMRTELANEVIKKISNANPHVLQSEIVEIQVQTKEKRDSAANLQQSLPNGNSNVYKLLCVGCKTEITTSEHIRHINKQHHVIVDKGFPERANIQPIRPPYEVAPDVKVTGKIWCKNSRCKENWGSCMNHKQIPIFVLRVKGFVMSDESENWLNAKQWCLVPFYHAIPELDPGSISLLSSMYDQVESDDEFDYSFFD